MVAQLCAPNHVVLLLSPQDFEHPPLWLSENFNILEGGMHAGWLTACSLGAQQLTRYPGQSSQNKLIVFADGTYLELFCWIDTPREFHAWTKRSPGLIAFAFTSLPPSTAQSLHNDVVSRLRRSQSIKELGISYTPPEAGGRSRPDGVQVKWELSRPVFPMSVNSTDFPFFCHDVTPRTIRIPFDDNKTEYPCGAVGISTVEVLVPPSSADKFAETYGLILDVPPRIYDERGTKDRSDFLNQVAESRLWPINCQSSLRTG